ncbi:MAG TPA: hypothetical protein VLN59_05455, partial [Burkholderiales bacterium]|nr:hypothetical protein [Burkholderiales bacterium]
MHVIIAHIKSTSTDTNKGSPACRPASFAGLSFFAMGCTVYTRVISKNVRRMAKSLEEVAQSMAQ